MIVRVFGKLGIALLAIAAMSFGMALQTGASAAAGDDYLAWRHAERTSYVHYGHVSASAYLHWRMAERASYRAGHAVLVGTYQDWRQSERGSYRSALQSSYLEWRRSERASASFTAPRLAVRGGDGLER